MLRQRALGVYRRELAGVDLDELAAAGRAVLADGEPRFMDQLARAVAGRWPDPGTRPLGEMLVAAVLPMVQTAAARGVADEGGGAQRAGLLLARARDRPAAHGRRLGPGGQDLVRRYLAAYGPAATADVRAWSGLAGLPGAVAALRGELITFRDQRGRELLDLPDAPRPGPRDPGTPAPRHPGTPAPVRFLPAFDKAEIPREQSLLPHQATLALKST
ncbi:DNA glycosylase AlkZ-like family protein [Streptomyces sp. NPDC058629]|uniref:DNA glycosylase AlkZ-like family protein n=1 Tax=Streptomyces sp. NPDC058629 TaxID=3346565 RepID=UPI003649DAC9